MVLTTVVLGWRSVCFWIAFVCGHGRRGRLGCWIDGGEAERCRKDRREIWQMGGVRRVRDVTMTATTAGHVDSSQP